MERTFTAIFKKVDGWYVGYVEELPGANTRARTLGEARDNPREAIMLVLDARRELASDTAPDSDTVREEIQVNV